MDTLRNFIRDDDGAVTVDWVVLTAAIVGLGLGAVATAQDGINTVANAITERMEGIEL